MRHEDQAEHVGEGKARLELEQRRQRQINVAQSATGQQFCRRSTVEHRGRGGAGQGRNERERGGVIGNDEVDELSTG
jgi:hypothetical protein